MITYEIVCGLEVHVELSTDTKIFCGCSTAFGGEPNTQVCPVCTGMPGTLPVLNKAVVDYAIRTGLALGCDITRHSKFDRKNYFYPDLPKAYQISQLYHPICRDGGLRIEGEGFDKVVGIHEIHMEEDAGKLLHDPWDECTLIDYNRCGVPLLEIVSEPDMSSAEEVVAYLTRLREILLFLGVSDCKMQEGSMRADVNLSVRPVGSGVLGVRTEMKNMNSFKMIARAVEYEAKRQIALLEAGEKVVQQTRRWDDNKDKSFPMRDKENAQDYRYFPEPDLPPIDVDQRWIDGIAAAMPELPVAKRQRYRTDLGLTDYDAVTLTASREIAALFEATTAALDSLGNKAGKEAANWIMTDVMRLMTDTTTLPEDLSLSPHKLAAVIRLVAEGKINRGTGKAVLEQVFSHDVDPEAYCKEQGLFMVEDDVLVRDTVAAVLEQNPKAVQDYRDGVEKAYGFLVGQVMRALGGKANPKAVGEALREALA